MHEYLGIKHVGKGDGSDLMLSVALGRVGDIYTTIKGIFFLENLMTWNLILIFFHRSKYQTRLHC